MTVQWEQLGHALGRQDANLVRVSFLIYARSGRLAIVGWDEGRIEERRRDDLRGRGERGRIV